MSFASSVPLYRVGVCVLYLGSNYSEAPFLCEGDVELLQSHLECVGFSGSSMRLVRFISTHLHNGACEPLLSIPNYPAFPPACLAPTIYTAYICIYIERECI